MVSDRWVVAGFAMGLIPSLFAPSASSKFRNLATMVVVWLLLLLVVVWLLLLVVVVASIMADAW